MSYNIKYFVVNLVIEGFVSLLPEKTQVNRLSYIITEAIEDVFNNGNYCYYIYTGFCFKGIHIKKSLSAKNVCRLITDRFHNFTRSVPESLTDEEILSMIEYETIFDIIPVSTKSKLYSYNI